MSEIQSDTGNDSWGKWLFRVSLLFTLISAILFGLRDSLDIMIAAIVAGGLGMAFCSLDKIALFKGGSFEIRTLEREVQENSATIERIKSLALELSKPILGIIAAGGRYGGSYHDKEAGALQITDYLREIGISEGQIRNAMIDFNAYRVWDHAQNIEWSCRELSNETTEVLNSLKDYDRLFVSSPDTYRERLRELDLLDEYTEDAIRDYEHFLQHRELRRPEVWLKLRREQESMRQSDT